MYLPLELKQEIVNKLDNNTYFKLHDKLDLMLFSKNQYAARKIQRWLKHNYKWRVAKLIVSRMIATQIGIWNVDLNNLSDRFKEAAPLLMLPYPIAWPLGLLKEEALLGITLCPVILKENYQVIGYHVKRGKHKRVCFPINK